MQYMVHPQDWYFLYRKTPRDLIPSSYSHCWLFGDNIRAAAIPATGSLAAVGLERETMSRWHIIQSVQCMHMHIEGRHTFSPSKTPIADT